MKPKVWTDSGNGLHAALNKLDVILLTFGAMLGWGWVILTGEWILSAGAFGAAAAFQQRQRQQSVERQRFFRHEDAPILRQRRAKESAVQRVVEVGGEHRVERLVKRRVRLPVAQRGAAQEAQRGAKRLLELAEAAVDRVAHGEQRAGQVVRRVAGGIGLAQRLGAEGADGLRGLTDEGVAVLREAAIRVREPDVQPRRIERKARRGQRREAISLSAFCLMLFTALAGAADALIVQGQTAA